MDLRGFSIDRSNGLPIAEQLASHILREILDGHSPPGEKLPAERDLARELRISRGTVKRAYAQLRDAGAIEIRQGSGSYVLANGEAVEENQRKAAADLIAATFSRLQGMGLSNQEILSLANLHALSTSGGAMRKISIMVVSNNHDILSELEQQLAYLTASSPFLFTLSFLTLDTITGYRDPVQMLLGYDLIIATTIDYRAVAGIAPMLQSRIVEARLSPRTRTLLELSAVPPDTRVRVIHRTDAFREMVRQCLLSLGFRAAHLSFVLDRDYNPVHHNEDGVGLLVNHNESPVYTDPAFRERNEAFEAAGGRILRFAYQIERGSLMHIEDRLQRLLRKADEDH